MVTKQYLFNGSREYGSSWLHQYVKEEGVILHIITPYSSEGNGYAEINKHIICTTAHKLILQDHLSKDLWPYTIQAAIYLYNIMLSDMFNSVSPYQVLTEAFR